MAPGESGKPLTEARQTRLRAIHCDNSSSFRSCSRASAFIRSFARHRSLKMSWYAGFKTPILLRQILAVKTKLTLRHAPRFSCFFFLPWSYGYSARRRAGRAASWTTRILVLITLRPHLFSWLSAVFCCGRGRAERAAAPRRQSPSVASLISR